MHLLMQTNGDRNTNHPTSPSPNKTPPSLPAEQYEPLTKERTTQEKEVLTKQRINILGFGLGLGG
jgi:hypothetical protein